MTIRRISKYINILRTNMSSVEFRLKKKIIDKTRNYFIGEIKQWFNQWKA